MLLEEGRSVPEVASELKVLANTLHKRSVRGGCPPIKKTESGSTTVNHHQKRAQPERQRSADGKCDDAFAGTCGGGDGEAGIGADRIPTAYDVPQGGVLLALPALLAEGLLRYSPQMYHLPDGFYGIDSIFLLLAFMALARIRSMEQLRYQAPGEWGKVLGLIASRKCGRCARSWDCCAGIWVRR